MKIFSFFQKIGRFFFGGLLLFVSIAAAGQYFGRNKVNYRQFNFRVLKSPHFEIYHYTDDTVFLHRLARQCEQWYLQHQKIFEDSFSKKNPVIFYNHHAHFQQTRTIPGLLGTGTGGVTEALKNRVIMPLMESNAQTDHVLGHELVHAFQYHLLKNTDSLALETAFENLPLWMVEGLAEYLSLGYTDPHTATWMRAAVLHDKLPTLKDLTRKPFEFFPYRWGHAFWAYVGGVWGDDIILKLFTETAFSGYDTAIEEVLGLTEKEFSEKWKDALRKFYHPWLQQASFVLPGKQLLHKGNAGKVNVVPAISPDGTLVAFWTEKDIFTFDLYVADAVTGHILKKITSNSFNTHIDEYSSYESSIAWSPDSRLLAFVAFKKGENHLIIADAEKGKIKQEFRMPEVDGFSNPAWSPDGEKIVLTGIKNGQSDLYLLNLHTGKTLQLTHDSNADLQPSFSPDGKKIVFATDRNSRVGKYPYRRHSHQPALYDIGSGAIYLLEIFPGANNLNPLFGSDNKTIFFLSDRDGFRNLYTYSTESGDLMQLTRLQTGITGITEFSPAISVAQNTVKVLYTCYTGDGYEVYSASDNDFLPIKVNSSDVNLSAAILPPLQRSPKNYVEKNLNQRIAAPVADTSLSAYSYRSKFQLDYIGNTGFGISGSRFGTGLSGGISGIFSDMLGYHQLYGAMVLNGELVDAGGMLTYLNQKKRINWAVGVSHIPYLSGFESFSLDTLIINSDSVKVVNHSLDLLRVFEERVSMLGIYPFSQTRRLETGLSLARYHYRLDRYTNYYYEGYLVGYDEQKKLPVPRGFNFGHVYAALVGDNSHFGGASPLVGHRYRLEAGRYFGFVNAYTVLGDYRKYLRMHPFTLAGRGLFYGRMGNDADNENLSPLYLGYPGLVRGYNPHRFTREDVKLNINDLLGSRIFVSNAELRYPLTGPRRLAPIRSNAIYSEMALFTDGGIAWGNSGMPADIKGELSQRHSSYIMSSGILLRINLFGYIIIEPHYVIPWQNGGWRNGYFTIGFLPGW